MKLEPVAPARPVLVGRSVSPEILAKIAADATTYVFNLSKKKGRSWQSYARLLEQYYTRGHIVQPLWAILRHFVDLSKYLIIDPCAGNAVFARNSTNSVMSFDVDPKDASVIQANFLAITVEDSSPIAVIGNPPFRFAVDFFNHAATMSDVIAMIFPASFAGNAMRNKLNKNFHCIYQLFLPSHSFTHEGASYDAPAVFQVWIKKQEARVAPPPQPKSHPDFRVGTSESAHFSIRRIGVRAGEIHLPYERRGKSYLHVTVKNPVRAAQVESIFRGLSLAGVAKSKGKYASINMEEIVALYSAALARRGAITSEFSNMRCRYELDFVRSRTGATSRRTWRLPRRPEASSQCVLSYSQHLWVHCPAKISEPRQ